MNYCEICFLSLLDLLLICGRTSAYYSKNYGEYNLTIRDNAGNQDQWMTQAGAQEWCRNNLNGSLLASVTNSGFQTNIAQFANDAISAGLSKNDIILNAQLELIDWQWLKGQLLKDTEIQGQTTDSNYLLYAYLLIGNYGLMASRPTDKRSFLCQYSGETSNCGDNGFQFHGRCYRIYDNLKVSWFDARINCQREGGDLASFEYLTRDTLSTLNSSGLYPTSSTDYWVGLKRLKWKWLDTGSEVNFTSWFDGHPSDYNKKCICLGSVNNFNWKWIDCDCSQSHQFICLTVIIQTTTLPSGLSTPVSLPIPTPVSSTVPTPLTSPSSSLASAVTTNYSYISSLKSNDFSTTPVNSLNSSQQNRSADALAIGLGVGLGAGILLVVLLVVVVALLIRKRKRNPVASNKSKPPQMELQNDEEIISQKNPSSSGIYALVLQQKEGVHDLSTAVKEQQPVVYDKIEHVNKY